MHWLAMGLIGLVGLAHLGFLYMEMFKWGRMARRLDRSVTEDFIARSSAMAANQGLYNGFLAAGLFWALLIGDPLWQSHVATFFLTCVIVAGVYGAVTVSRRILAIQAVPACLAMLALHTLSPAAL